MKLVPLGDKIVLKQLEAEETTKSGIVLTGPGTGETAAGRSHCRWTWRNGRWKRSDHAGKSRR